MPDHYSLDTLPKPKNPMISILEVEPVELAAVSWKGEVPSESKIESKEVELKEIIDENQYEHEGNAMLFEYDPPFTPSWMRNNEILLKVNKK